MSLHVARRVGGLENDVNGHRVHVNVARRVGGLEMIQTF